MAIVVISKGSYTHGTQVAEQVAARLELACVARETLLAEVSADYDVPELRLMRAVENAPSLWQRLSSGRDRFVTYMEAAVLGHLRRDNVVYHGLFGHFFVGGIPQILKVRVSASLEDRARIVMQRDDVDLEQAIERVRRDDEERAAWSRHFYGIDVGDPSYYDLVINVSQLSVRHAADIVCNALETAPFQTTPAVREQVDDLAIAAAVKVAIFDLKPEASVRCWRGRVEISIQEKVVRVDAVAERIKQRATAVAGVESVKVDTEVTA